MTPAAAIISFAVSIVVAAMVARATSEFRLARAELARTQAEYALAAAHNAAVLAIFTSNRPPPYRWKLANLGDEYEVIAEPEYLKLSPRAFANLDDEAFAQLGIADPEAVKRRLLELRQDHSLVWIADLADSFSWRGCAASLGSPYGHSVAVAPQIYRNPNAGSEFAFWHSGEIWRIRITDRSGWRDERIVRFTGSSLTPAAIIGRHISRNLKGPQPCESQLWAFSGD